jgi:hypothetical protein
LEFLDIFQHDDVGLGDASPLQHDPCKAPDILLDRLSALRFREVFAVWREPSKLNMPPNNVGFEQG